MSKYTKEELQGLIAETRAQLGDLLKSEGKQIAAPEAIGGQMKKEEGSPPPEESSASESGSAPAPSAPASDAAAGGPPAPDASASAAPAPDAGGSAGGAPADMPTLVAAYSQLSPEELQMHVQALQQVMSASQAQAGAGAPPPGGMPPGAPAGAPPAPAGPPAGMPPAGPDAVAPMPGEGSKPIDPAMAMKSESDKELLQKLTKAEGSVKSLESSVEKIAKAMELMLAKPQRKAVTGKDLAKSAKEVEKVDVTKLNKSQLTAKLSELARKPELKKSERNLINSFYSGKIKVEALAPLFETK